MLQIIQGMYFRPVPLNTKLHRAVFYTNLCAFREEVVDLQFSRILPSTNFQGVRSLTIEAKEQLEAVTRTGGREILLATSGHELLDDIADVIAFSLNVVCVRDYDMAHRLISRDGDERRHLRGPASILRQTFNSMVVLTDERIANLDAFLRTLISLKRKSYEAAIRVIRQIVDATQIVDEDATLAYTLMVAALESLGQAAEPQDALWDEYEPQKRARIDEATKGLSLVRKSRIQTAVLANEHLALQRRFVAFVLKHVQPSFYRGEAVGAIRPIAAGDLPRALRQAYAIRSRNVYALEGLDPEVWMVAQQADTALARSCLVLSLEGLARLCRHVVRRFIDVAPKGVDPDFDYRLALPGMIRAQLAPQYWIHDAAGFNRKSAPAYLNGMIEYLIEGLSKRSESALVDMGAILDRIDRSAPGLTKRDDRLAMAGIM